MVRGLRALKGTTLHERLADVLDQLGETDALAPILSDRLRGVGFRSFPSSGEEFLAELVSDLEQELAIQRLDIEDDDGLDELHIDKAERERLLLQLEGIEAILREVRAVVHQMRRHQSTIQPRSVGIGHNQPPDVIAESEFDEAALDEGVAAVDALGLELKSEQPRSSVVRLCALVLARLGRTVAGLLGWIKRHVDLFTEAFAKSMGSATGKLVAAVVAAGAGGFILNLEGLHLKIGAVVSSIWQLF